jgi:6-phosphofructokinase 1
MTGKETRSLVLGHLQRGGSPTTFDRLLGLRFGAGAIRLVAEQKFGMMVALQPPRIVPVPIADAVATPRRVSLDSDTIATARDLGTSFGD